MDNIVKQISDLLKALPEEIQTVIYDGKLDNQLKDLAAKYNISSEDIEKIKGEVILTIIKMNKKEELEKNLTGETMIDKGVLSKVSNELIQNIISPLDFSAFSKPNNNEATKEGILNEIENPIPVKPLVVNPAGKNPILDAQHNLPAQEKKILISSAAVPSRGPMIGNIRSNFQIPPVAPKASTLPNIAPTIPAQEPVKTPAPAPYKVDPYREPLV